jgi:CRP-like cAMP-binding protein
MAERPSIANTRNRLLRALAPESLARLAPQLEHAEFDTGEVIHERGEPVVAVCFPETVVVSVVTVMNDGTEVETGTIGNEGFAGLNALLEMPSLTRRTYVQVPGTGWTLGADALRDASEADESLRRLIRRYTQSFIEQAAQMSACNRLHPLDKRCARWLISTADQVGGETFHLTHEFLSEMLGVRRSGVTVAAGALQKAGLITYVRGRVTVLDRAGLRAAACECYDTLREVYARVAPEVGQPVP